MNFQKIHFMAWAKRSHDLAPCACDLGTSAVEHVPAEMLGPLDGLPIRGNNAYGHPGLRGALAERYGVPGGQVLCSVQGSSMANFLVASALVRPGERVAVEWPAYEPLWRIFEALEARVEFFARRPEDRYGLDLDRVAEAFARGARVLIISNLMNPSGVLVERPTVRAAGAIAARHGGFVIADEVYLDAAFDPARARSAAAGGDGEGVIVTSSLTKAYGLGSLRAGFAIAPEAVVERAYAAYDHLAVEQCYVADLLALRALERLPAIRARAERRQRENYPLVRDFARGRADLDLVEPDGGFVVWLGLKSGWTSAALEPALRARGVTVAPGYFFGMDSHIRLGFGGPADALVEGLARLAEVLDSPPPPPGRRPAP